MAAALVALDCVACINLRWSRIGKANAFDRFRTRYLTGYRYFKYCYLHVHTIIETFDIRILR